MTENAATSQPIINIVGEQVALGPLRRDLLPTYTRWVNDLAVTRNLGRVTPMTLEQETEWFDHTIHDPTEIVFLLYERATERPIGTTGLSHIRWGGHSALFGILIGEADARGKGYGTEAARLVLDYAFTALGLRNVMLTVAEWNVAGQRAYKKAGFKEIGRRRSCWFMGARWWDEVYMDCLASEFTSPVLAGVFTPNAPR